MLVGTPMQVNVLAQRVSVVVGVASRRARRARRGYNRGMEDTKLVEVRACSNRIEAELTKGALEAARIEAIIQADTVGRMREHLAWSGAGFKILVREEDAAAARAVLDAPAVPDENFEGIEFDADDSGEHGDEPFATRRRFT
jgi:Putative prokaryotic signal transducing protein